MKKITLLFVCFLAALACGAADFDEAQLIGKWNVTSATGNWNNYITSINTIQFGDVKIVREYSWGDYTYWKAGYLANIDFIAEADFKDIDDYKEMTFIYDFFISNGNKLHIITDDDLSNNSIRLVIKELNDETMTLESFDGTAQFVLSKESAAVQTIQSDVTNQSSTIYDVQGRPVSNIQSGNIYIKGNNKFIAK